MPFFFVDDAFGDSKEVMAIPARHRNAAVGLWVRCGAWSANKLTDGFVPWDVVRMFTGRTDLAGFLINEAHLWDAETDGILFRNWNRWQRSSLQVRAYRERQAEKKRRQRSKTKPTPTCGDAILSPGDSLGDGESCPPGTPQTPIPIPIPNYVSNVSSYVTKVTREPLDAAAATPAAELIAKTIPREHPDAVKTLLRIRASELLHQGTDEETITAALELWLLKPKLGPNVLPSLVSEVIKSRAAPPHSTDQSVVDSKVNGWLNTDIGHFTSLNSATFPKELT